MASRIKYVCSICKELIHGPCTIITKGSIAATNYDSSGKCNQYHFRRRSGKKAKEYSFHENCFLQVAGKEYE